MVSKILIKLIDFSIFPAILVVFAKVVGVVFLINYFKLDFNLEGFSLVLDNKESYLAVNSYSSLFMIAAVISGLIWVLVKAHIFHDTHITPFLSAKIHNMDMEEVISSTKTIYLQSFIWISYIWLITLMVGVQSYFELSYLFIFYISLAVAVISSVVLVVDIERELIKDEEKLLEVNDGDKSRTIKIESLKEVIFS